MNKTYKLLNINGTEMSVVVYPWPQQIQNDILRSKHVDMWERFCFNKCKNFLNFFPFFLRKKIKLHF